MAYSESRQTSKNYYLLFFSLYVIDPCEKCPYSELFWFTFSNIRTENGEIIRISSYSVRMWENADQNNSEYGHFLRSAVFVKFCYKITFTE